MTTPRTNSIKIGCCGFRSARADYYALLPAVEVQHTFYQPPQLATLEKWRAEAPPEFEFTVKAWQLITHLARSPTYKRLKRELTEAERDEAGAFRASKIVREAWATTHACAVALRAKTVLFQCPASFRPTESNIANLRRFFKRLKPARGALNFCWEPRGDWPRETIRELCAELDLWHVVDPFAARTVTPTRCYFRLHGRGGWRYQYEDGELEELRSMLPADAEAYVFFNNIKMIEDAARFQEIVAGET
ncbi:MAG TPA: DUF72 domain-containing protein [Pyrinomonadaceae bacterium]|jgi:uncharacterized protein YecE (DUF72 family)|nr:DUF72 domain-containing protein [Pyrinomonadaceae bacterium]